MVHDEHRRKMVLYGGGYGVLGNKRGDTWEFDGAQWTLVANTGPAPRELHAMAYDNNRRVAVLFGGLTSSGRQGDTWEWDGSSWTQVADSGPSPRSGHAMIYDKVRGVTVLYGGYDGATRSDTWEWNGEQWTQVSEDAPPARRYHAMVFDSVRNAAVLFGGRAADSLDDMWTYQCRVLDLRVSPTCPSGGPIVIEWFNATPDTLVGLLYALDTGSIVIPRGQPCAGTMLGLGSRNLKLAYTWRSDESGSGKVNRNATSRACGGYLQLLDAASCATSNVVLVE